MILTILKIIGIILLVIIALVIALLLLVLLWPVTYKASADLKPEIKKGGATVSWLLGALKLRLTFDSSLEKPFVRDIRIFGISLDRIKSLLKGKDKGEKAKEARKKKLKKLKEKDPERYEQLREEARERRRLEREKLKAEEEAEKQAEAARRAELKKTRARPRKKIAFTRDTVIHAIRRFVRHTLVYFVQFIQDLVSLPGLIIHKIGEIAAKIKSAAGMASRWLGFATDAGTWQAVGFILKKLKKLLRHIRPRKISGHLIYGFDDPYQTGLVLAGAEAFYPVWGRSFTLDPDFATKRLEGEAALKGHIVIGYVIWQALMVWFNKDVKEVIAFLKHEKEIKNG